MQKEDGSRLSRRAALHRTAWMEAEHKQLVPCVVVDISNGGAQLCVSDEHPLPEDFSIRLTADGRVRRNCHLIWRKSGRIGVSFQAG